MRNHKNWAAAEELSSVFELKAHLENILKRLGGVNLNKVQYEPLQNDIFSTGMGIKTKKQQIGSFGIVSPAILKTFDIETGLFFLRR